MPVRTHSGSSTSTLRRTRLHGRRSASRTTATSSPARVGCQTYVPAFGISFGALCVRPISVDDAGVVEGDSGPRTVNVTASLTEVDTADYPVRSLMRRRTGRPDRSTTTATSGTFTFDLGETTKTVSVDISATRRPKEPRRSSCGSQPTKGTVIRVEGIGRSRTTTGPPRPCPRTRARSSARLISRASGPRLPTWKCSGAAHPTTRTSTGTRSSGRAHPTLSQTMSSTSPAPPRSRSSRMVSGGSTVRAVDRGGNPAAGAAQAGPFLTDTESPEDPDVWSDTHEAHDRRATTPSTRLGGCLGRRERRRRLSIDWRRPPARCPTIGSTRPPRGRRAHGSWTGAWWFHLRTADEAGHGRAPATWDRS